MLYLSIKRSAIFQSFAQGLLLSVCINLITLALSSSDNLNILEKRNVLKHNLLKVDLHRLEYIDLEKTLWTFLNHSQPDWQADIEKPIKLKKVYNAHLQFMDNIQSQEHFGNASYDYLHLKLSQSNQWISLRDNLWNIEHMFKQLKNFMYNERDHLEANVLIQHVQNILRNDLHLSMSQIYQDIEILMINNTFYYQAMVSIGDKICELQQSQHQFIYTLYSNIALSELKGYILMQFAWMVLTIYGKGSFLHASQEMRDGYYDRVERALKQMRIILAHADLSLWKCDPFKHVKSETYDEVTRLLQGYIENEVDLNTDGTCRENCGYYQSTRSEGCFKDLYCARQPRCSGKLYKCTYVDAHMWVCPAALGSTRRYEFIEFENGRVLGQKSHCVRGTTKVDSWWRYLFWHCSYCFCLCDEISLKSDRYFNLRDSLSDVSNNKVVTGLRFIKHNRVFHLQIQEGVLMSRGAINTSTLSWKPVSDYKIFDRSVHNGIDYHTLTYESRSIDLDDIYTDDNTFVVTGVRFRVIGAHLNLEVRFSEFNFGTGKLFEPAYSYWKSNDNTEVSGQPIREELKLFEPEVSSRCLVKSFPDSQHNQYINFVHTDMNKDVAQTTVPFIDIQNVTPNVAIPLSGVGIYHKGRNGYGGFIAPKIMTFNFTPHAKTIQ